MLPVERHGVQRAALFLYLPIYHLIPQECYIGRFQDISFTLLLQHWPSLELDVLRKSQPTVNFDIKF